MTKAIFDLESLKALADTFGRANYPYYSYRVSTLGGKDRPSIMLAISLMPQSKWKNGIFENSPYLRLHIDHLGVVEEISRSRELIKFRKFTSDDSSKIYEKVNAYVTKQLASMETASASYKAKMSPKRAKEILALKARTLLGQGDVRKFMTEDEINDITHFWNTLPGSMSFVNAIEKIAKMRVVEEASTVSFEDLVAAIKDIFNKWNVRNPDEGLKQLWMGEKDKLETSLVFHVVKALKGKADKMLDLGKLAKTYVEYCLDNSLLERSYSTEKGMSSAIHKSFIKLMPKLYKRLNSKHSNIAGYSEKKLDKFYEVYAKTLFNYIKKNPNEFSMKDSTEAEIEVRAKELVTLSKTTILNSAVGIKSLYLSPSLIKAAKTLGIKPTYRDIDTYLSD